MSAKRRFAAALSTVVAVIALTLLWGAGRGAPRARPRASARGLPDGPRAVRDGVHAATAAAFIAARLNGFNGANTSTVSAQLATAATLFATHTPAAIGALKGTNPLRQQFIMLAAFLDAYNNGPTGPGHCQ